MCARRALLPPLRSPPFVCDDCRSGLGLCACPPVTDTTTAVRALLSLTPPPLLSVVAVVDRGARCVLATCRIYLSSMTRSSATGMVDRGLPCACAMDLFVIDDPQRISSVSSSSRRPCNRPRALACSRVLEQGVARARAANRRWGAWAGGGSLARKIASKKPFSLNNVMKERGRSQIKHGTGPLAVLV